MAGMQVRGRDDMPPTHDARMEELFRAHYTSLVRFGVAVTGSVDAGEEVAQEAFLAAWNGLENLRDPDAAGAYLRRTVMNLVKRKGQRRSLERRLLRPVRDRVEDRDLSARLHLIEAMRELPVRQRACVALRYYEDLTEEETARVLDISVGTVKSQTHKALRRLRAKLGEAF